MADPEASTDVPKPDSKAAQADDSPGRSWMVPIITVALLATAFCLYYFVYVGARREYLVNRNFRTLAALGDQLQRTLSVHGTILEFYSSQANQTQVSHFLRGREDIRNFLVVRPEDRELPPGMQIDESRKDYLHYLAPTLDLGEAAIEPGASSKPRNRLQVQRRNGRWEVTLSAERARSAQTDYLGSLDVREVMKVRGDSAAVRRHTSGIGGRQRCLSGQEIRAPVHHAVQPAEGTGLRHRHQTWCNRAGQAGGDGLQSGGRQRGASVAGRSDSSDRRHAGRHAL
jgi:hypothetical protein